MTERELKFLIYGLRLGTGGYTSLCEYDRHRRKFGKETKPLIDSIEKDIELKKLPHGIIELLGIEEFETDNVRMKQVIQYALNKLESSSSDLIDDVRTMLRYGLGIVCKDCACPVDGCACKEQEGLTDAEFCDKTGGL